MIFIQYPFICGLKCLNSEEISVKAGVVRKAVASYLDYEDFSLIHKGKILYNDEIPNNSTVFVTFSLPGGKGGFGSMLRAIGAQIEKTTNREACRDLSGRRLRDINEEQRLKKWIAKEAEREAEKLKRRQARLERLKTKPPHNFFDFEYQKEISELPERVNEALHEGLQKVKQPMKRSHEKSEGSELPKKSWLSDDFSASSNDSDSNESTEDVENPFKKPKTMPMDSSSSDSDTSNISQSYQGSSKENYVISSDSEQTVINNPGCSSNHVVPDINAHEHLKREGVSEKINVDKDECKYSPEKCSTEVNKESCKEVKDTEKTVECKEKNMQINEDKKIKNKVLDMKNSTPISAKEFKVENYAPINLLYYGNATELEELGLDWLKAALMSRGLKCGGTLSDRAQRLWKVRGLQSHEYPANLLAKNKK